VDEPNPYAPPVSSSASPDATPSPGEAPAFKLYTPGHAAVVTFFGTPLAGFFLVYANRRRLGDARGATQALILGFVATVATFAMAFLLPDAIGRAVPLAGVFAVRAYAALDRAKLDAHRRAGGKQESGWKVTGISLVALVLMLFLFGGGVLFIEAVTGKEW
jgi:uncharacterized membrane protein